MSLENKVGQGKPSLEQWVPVWGFYITIKDKKDGKPSVIDGKLMAVSAFYHGASATLGLAGLIYLADKYIF